MYGVEIRIEKTHLLEEIGEKINLYNTPNSIVDQDDERKTSSRCPKRKLYHKKIFDERIKTYGHPEPYVET